MSSSPSPSRTESRHDREPGLPQQSPSAKEMTDSEEEDEEDHSDGDVITRDENTDGKECNELEIPNTMVDEDDNHSVSSYELLSDAEEFPRAPSQTPLPPLGLSRRGYGYSNYDHFDVVTVHGLRDDHQTAWTSLKDGSDWIESDLFSSSRIRHLDYVYDISDSARIYGPNGVVIEANALLDSLVQKRAQLFNTEHDRPIIWICHDLGGSIVKQALINAIFSQPKTDSQDDTEDPMAIRKTYRRLPLLTSTIIFLGCPHGSESKEFLEDQLFGLMCLPGPPVRTRVLQKISSLASQIERINLEFLETNILDRALVVNITSAPKEQQTDEDCEPQGGHQSTEAQKTVNEQTPGTPQSSRHLFPIHPRCMAHNSGIFYTAWWDTTDHLGLVMGHDSSGSDWASYFSDLFDKKLGWNTRNNYAFLAYQNSLLSLSAPTRLDPCRIKTGGSSIPALVDWVIEHDAFNRLIHKSPGTTAVYVHGGSREAIDMKLLSHQVSIEYDIITESQFPRSPDYSSFYYEFDRHDSRRCSIKAMIISFVCTYAGRFWADKDDEPEWSAQYMARFNCWSLKDLLNVFLRVQQTGGMRKMPMILGQIDQCDEQERSVFLQAMIKLQYHTETRFHLLITTTRPEGSICEIWPADSTINLDDCPLSLDEFLCVQTSTSTGGVFLKSKVYPNRSGAAEGRLDILLARRPEFTCVRPHLHQVFQKFRDVPSLQGAVLEWLANYKLGCSPNEAADIIREVSADPHKRLFRGLMGQLSVETQLVMTHVYNWIRYAAEPLTLEILAEAVRCSLPQELAQLHYLQNHEEFGRFVERNMGGIILPVGRDIRFSEDSFYEISRTGELCDEHKSACSSHADITAVCLRYLVGREGQKMLASLSVESQGMDDPSWSPIMLPRHSLVSYALRFWTFHYQAAGEYRPIDLATELLQDTLKRGAWAEALYVVSNPFTRSHKGYISPLPYMAMFGLDDLVLRHIQDGTGQDGSNQDNWLAIAEAARNGHGNTVALLLEHSDTDVDGLGEALHWAASYGEAGALDCLISKAQELEHYQWPSSILHRAVVAGLENLVSALVESGYDLDEESGTGEDRAVHTAIRYGQDRVLKILLDSGRVDLGPQDGHAQSTLVLAVKKGNTESMKHMLDAGVSPDDFKAATDVLFEAVCSASHGAVRMLIDAQVVSKTHIRSKARTNGEEYFFALEIAAERSYRTCTRILLDNDADPNALCEGGSALYKAIINTKDEPTILMLLEKGASPNQPVAAYDPVYDGDGMFLMRAIETGSESLVKMLLDYGAKINVADPNRIEYDIPLSWAIKCGYVDIVRLLLERGADANLVSERNPNCWSPLYTAAKCRLTDVIEPLIKHGANIHWTNKLNESVLHAAYDSADTLSTLLQNGADINATDYGNWTALMLAARRNHPQAVELLLKQTNPKADLEVLSSEAISDTALLLCCAFGVADIVKMLLEAGADINRQSSDGQFPLSQILKSDLLPAAYEDIVEFMLKRRPNLGLSDNQGGTVLHNIKSDTPLSVVMRLVEEGAPVNTIDELGYSPLAWAVECGNTKVARYLTTVKGVQSAVYHPTFGSILHIAAARSTLEVVRQLVRTGADHGIVDSVFGASVLYCAVGHEDDEERRKIVEYLVEEVGVDVNARGGEWICPLMRVACDFKEKDTELLEYLLKHGARTDSVDSLGRNAVHWVVLRDDHGDRLGELSTLFENGADLSVGDNYGRTPLHFAAGRGSLAPVKFILEKLSKGSEAPYLDAVDVDGWTPVMWACRARYHSTARFLVEEYKADIRVRSRDAEWSPLKIARLHDWSYQWAETLEPDLDAHGHEYRESQYLSQTAPGVECWDHECVSCQMDGLIGQAWYCRICECHLCFKCIRHSKTMHDPDHKFIEYIEEPSDGVQSNQSSESGNGSENEEQDEDDSESEEEEDDDSE